MTPSRIPVTGTTSGRPERAGAKAFGNRLKRDLAAAGAGSLFVLLVLHAGIGWFFSTALDDRALSIASRLERLRPDYNTEVLAAGEGWIELDTSADDRVQQPGSYGLAWEGGWGIAGDIRESKASSVVRAFELRSRFLPSTGTFVDVDTRVYQGDPREGLGIDFEEVNIDGDLGSYPAWYVPGEGDTWFVFLHGNGMTRRDALRMLPPMVDMGLPVLIPTMRGDEGAPRAEDGRLTYGKDEWRDLEAAVAYAKSQGAEWVIIEGMSMGGGIVVAFLLESPLAGDVAGVVLDAPVLDFEQSVDFQAQDEAIPLIGAPLPDSVVAVGKWIAVQRFGVDWQAVSFLDRVDELDTPILLIHGTDDDTVPSATSDELARRRPELVTEYFVVEGAGHVEAWNVDTEGYERRLRAFVEAVTPGE